MLTFESPFYEIKGIIVFRDHADPLTFHYLAGPPRLTRDNGKPNLLLLKYRHALDAMGDAKARTRDQLGGAFVMFGTDCGIDESVKRAVKDELQSRMPPGSGPVSLVPVLYTKGKVNIIALDRQMRAESEPQGNAEQHSKFVRGIVGTATPSLLQDQRAIFSVALDPDAATLIEKAYESELSPIGVMYELDFSGLRPALAVTAHVNQKLLYEQFKMGLQIGVTPGTGAAGGGTTGGTTQPGGGTTQPAPGGGTTQPAPGGGTTQPAPGGGTTQPAAGSGSAASSRTQVALSADIGMLLEKAEQTGAVKIEIVQQQEGESASDMRRQALELLKETLLKDFFRPAMSVAQAGSSSSASTAAAAASAAGTALAASSGNTSKGVAGGGTQVQLGFQLQYKKQEELKELDYDFRVVAPETRTHAPNGFFSALLTSTERAKHIREIDLNDPFFKVLDVDVSTTADFDALDLRTMVVELQYGGTVANPAVPGAAEFTKANSASKHFQAFIANEDYRYRYRVDYKFGQAEHVAAQRSSLQSAWRTLSSRSLVVHPPDDVPMIRVYVEPGVVDWDLIDKIEATLLYEDPPNQFRAERRFILDKETKRDQWLVRLTNPALQEYKVKYTWHFKDRREFSSIWLPEKTAQLFVADPFVDRLQIRVRPQVDPNTIARIDVQVEYEDARNGFVVRKSAELEPPFKPTDIIVPLLDADAREYTYSVSLLKTNGMPANHAPKRTDREVIAILPDGVFLDVEAVLIGDMAALSIDALQLDLRSEPPEGSTATVESHLFLPGPEKKVTKKLVLRADRPQSFEYKTSLFAGVRQLESDWTKHTTSKLPLVLQRLLNPS